MSFLISGEARKVLTVPTSFYVSTTNGSDTLGDGSSSNPWKTIDFAHSVLHNQIDFGQQQVDLILQTTDLYQGCVRLGGYFGGGVLSIHGATSTSSNFKVTDNGSTATHIFGVAEDTQTELRFDQMHFQFSGASAVDCIFSNAKCTIWVAGFFTGMNHSINIDFDTNAPNNPNGFSMSGPSFFNVGGSNNITVPTAGRKLHRFYNFAGENDNGVGGCFANTFATWNLNGNITMATNQPWTFCEQSLYEPSDTMVGGTITGIKAIIKNGGHIETFGSGRNFLPGSLPIKVSQGGQYT